MGFWITTTIEVAGIITGCLIGWYWEDIGIYYKKVFKKQNIPLVK